MSQQTSVIAWLLIAMTPVLVLFSVFPESEISVRFKTVSAGGAVALFVWIWVRGTRLAAHEVKPGELEREVTEAKEQLEILQRERKRTARIMSFERHIYSVVGYPDRLIGIATGDLANVSGFDIWVNSENVNMRMAGIYEKSISATIRYLGSKVDEFGDPVEDTIMDELLTIMDKDNRSFVDPHTVLVTGAGRLAEKGVKCIFHVAASTRRRRGGSYPVPEIENCVLEALKRANTSEIAELSARSILLPLFGAGQGQGDLRETVDALIGTAIEYLRKQAEVLVPEVYFLAWTEGELDACRSVLQKALQYVIPKQ